MSQSTLPPADTVLVNGRILTFDAGNRTAQALAIRDGRVEAVGDNEAIGATVAAGTEVVDLAGRTALPGLADCHVHLASDAAVSEAVEARDFFTEIHSVQDILNRMREAARDIPPGTWIDGRGCPMQEYRLAERRLPTKAELDEVLPSHPAFITFGAHILVANTAALKSKNVNRDTADPQGGTVVKDPRTGEPTGVLLERAQFMVKARATALDPELLREAILIELEKCLRRGVTTIHDVIRSRNEVMAYQSLWREGRLPVRTHMIIRVIESGFQKESLSDIGIQAGFGDSFLKIGGIKMSIDGGFTGKNAAFSEKLEDEPCDRGLIRIKQDELDETLTTYHNAGIRTCVHAIGDVAMDMILKAHAKAIEANPRRDLRHRIEHLGNWMCTPERLALTKSLGAIPVPNPSLLYFLTKEITTTLGERRVEDAFPVRQLLDEGFPIAFGSDAPGYWPVDSLRDLGAAASHTAYDGLTLAPNQRITIMEALRAQTATAAWLGFEEQRLGTLEPGKLADVVVLGEDPLTFPPEQFAKLPVDCTIVNGKIVYDKAQGVLTERLARAVAGA